MVKWHRAKHRISIMLEDNFPPMVNDGCNYFMARGIYKYFMEYFSHRQSTILSTKQVDCVKSIIDAFFSYFASTNQILPER